MFITENYEIADITRIGIESLQLETVQFDTLLCHTCVTKERFINYIAPHHKCHNEKLSGLSKSTYFD